MKNEKKEKKLPEKKPISAGDAVRDAVKNRQKLELEIRLGKSQDTGKLREMRRSIARLLTEESNKQKAINKKQ